jgi:hypothetical protein
VLGLVETSDWTAASVTDVLEEWHLPRLRFEWDKKAGQAPDRPRTPARKAAAELLFQGIDPHQAAAAVAWMAVGVEMPAPVVSP